MVAGRSGESGAALVVVLFLLLIITLLGLASMRGAILQERMAGATYGRSLAFQAAETALRTAEASIVDTRPTVPATGCLNSVCVQPTPGAAPVWTTASFWGTSGNSTSISTGIVDTLAAYTIEDYGLAQSQECADASGTKPLDMSAPPCVAEIHVYRITSRAQTTSGAEVMLQSLFRAP
ncbi:pilus assembly PilX family protein [Cognatilysobacter lacus]|uniref:pilus assembly PilX family protein n=1 Tax=Cognatilysobacter lacus TaxID=1643323 RepID=UPI001F3B40C4|nr:PilX N-terminal domain-containing pilus assembly protein [Lysobacter lacus]